MPNLFWLGVVAASVAAVIMISLGFMVMWTGITRERDRCFAFFVLLVGGRAAAALFLRLYLWLEPVLPAGLGAERSLFWLEMTSLLLALMGNFGARFTVLFLGRRTRRTDRILNLGLLVTAMFAVPLFRHQLIISPSLNAHGVVNKELLGWGWVAMAILILHLLWSLALFWQERKRAGSSLAALSMSVLLIGVIVGTLLEQAFPVMSLTTALSAIILVYAVVTRQLFNPLRELTAELKREVAEREDAEDSYRTLVENAAQGLIIIQDGRLPFMNRALAEMSGYSIDELSAFECEDLIELIHPDDQAIVLERATDWLQEPGSAACLECRGVKRDGTVASVELSASYIKFRGKPAIQMAIFDITERESLLAQVREQARQLEQVTETVPAGVFLLDPSKRLVLANSMAVDQLELLTGLGVGQVLTSLGDRDLDELLDPNLNGEWLEIELANLPPRHFLLAARALGSQPDTEGWVVTLREVTQEREIQERAQRQDRLAAVGQLAAGIAHDFNNTLAVISLYAEIVRRSAYLTADDRERLATISTQARRAADLTEQILDFSRKSLLKRKTLNLIPFLKEQTGLLERTLEENIRIKLHHGLDDDIRIKADPSRLQQVLMNLAINARDAMPEGGELSISLDRTTVHPDQRPPVTGMEAGEWVRLRVADTGSGIEPDVLPHVFEPFFTTKSLGHGTGLGLAQVWGIVEQHQGQIAVDSIEGQGTTFTIYLPPQIVARQEPDISENTGSVYGDGQLILVVEDDAPIRDALVQTLGALNYRTLAAANGRDALELLETNGQNYSGVSKERVSLVLSDAVMPEMGGRELFDAIRKRELDVKMVMLTGHPLDAGGADLETQDISACLLKPPSIDTLASVIADTLRPKSKDFDNVRESGSLPAGQSAPTERAGLTHPAATKVRTANWEYDFDDY